MKRYGKYIRPCWYAFILGPLLMLTEVAGEVLLPSFMADIINVGAANHDVGYILQKGMIMILTAFIMMAGGVGGAWFASVAAINFGTGLRKDAFKKIQTFSFSEIDRFSTGSLVTRLTNDITQVQNLIMMALRMMLRAPGMLIGAIIMAFLMDRELAAVFLIVLPVMTVVILLLLRIAYPRFEFMQKKLDKTDGGKKELYNGFLNMFGIDKGGSPWITKQSVYNQFYSDLVTKVQHGIDVPGTTIHVFYATKMGKKYEKRYCTYFKNPDIRRHNMQHEELFCCHSAEWVKEVKKSVEGDRQ